MAGLQAVIDEQTLIRPWGLRCADCDATNIVQIGKKRPKRCVNCGSEELEPVHITDCPKCGEMVIDTDMDEHLWSHSEGDQ